MEWIKASERLPENSQWVYLPRLGDEKVWYSKEGNEFKRSPESIVIYHSVTHWKSVNENTRQIQRSDLFNKILTIVKLLELNPTKGDSYDHISVSVMLEKMLTESTPKGLSDEDINRLFDNNSDCYADTWTVNPNNDTLPMIEGNVIPAMTKETFVKIIKANSIK